MSFADRICDFCDQGIFFNDETFTSLTGGACLPVELDESEREAKMRKKIEQQADGFLGISWRAPYSRGEGGKLESVRLVEQGHQGQFELEFCSTSCLRSYLNLQVDSLEELVKTWCFENVRYTLSQGDRSTAVEELARHFQCSQAQAEEAASALLNGVMPDLKQPFSQSARDC